MTRTTLIEYASLTVVANAPETAGFAILSGSFNPRGLFLLAPSPTAVAASRCFARHATITFGAT